MPHNLTSLKKKTTDFCNNTILTFHITFQLPRTPFPRPSYQRSRILVGRISETDTPLKIRGQPKFLKPLWALLRLDRSQDTHGKRQLANRKTNEHGGAQLGHPGIW